MTDPEEIIQDKSFNEVTENKTSEQSCSTEDEEAADMEEILREKDQFRALAQRAQADLVNYRRRASEEKEEVRREANSRLLLNVLSIVDSVEKAVGLIPEDEVSQGWYEGLELVLRNAHKILESEGVTKIETEGRQFEPIEFEAVLHEETLAVEEGQILTVLREGYKHRNRVLRAAQVTVAKKRQESENIDKESTEEGNQ
jgi:molecular chaperone GrpE